MQKAAIPAALIVGAILGFLARPLIAPPSTPTTANAEGSGGTPADKLDADTDTTPSPTGGLPSAIVESDKDNKTTFTEGPVTITSSDGELPEAISLDFNEITKQMQAQQKKQDARRLALELAQLKARLSLTPQQEDKVRALLEARAEKKRGGIAELLGLAGGDSDEDPTEKVAAALGVTGEDTFDDDLAALLDPSQRDAYDTYRTERRANAIEAAAGRELASVQSLLSLTDEQKDRAFDAFTEIASAEMDGGNSDWSQADGIQRMLLGGDRRREALEPILTPEQMEIYENSPQLGGTMIFGSGGEAFGETGVISTIRIDASSSVGGGLLLESPPAATEE